jgi:hypothetical protein
MPLEVIGAGFGRTGTNSLKLALERLGFGPCHHMHELSHHPEQAAAWLALAQGGPADWEALFAGYRSQVDWPGARYWRELAAHYPNAKIVLTVRDPDEWFDSIEATILQFLAGRGNHPHPHQNAIAEMAHRLIDVGVFDGRMTDRRHATGVFRAHIAEVQAALPPSRLLTFDISEGWAPLCAFLGCEVPAISFPRLNSSRQFREEEWANNPQATA